MKFWKKKNSSKVEEISKNREFVAEALESRILYSGAPLEAEAPDSAPGDDSAESGQSEQASFATTDDFSGEIAPIEGESTVQGESVILTSFENLTEEEVKTLTSAAIDRWKETGLSEEQMAALDSIEVSFVDLEGMSLGAAEGYDVYLDLDAAGRGWFVDKTPFLDEEFGFAESSTSFRATDGDAVYGMDLLTVMMHEMGHVLGLEDIDATLPESLMFEQLSEGERRLPETGQAEGAEAGSLAGRHTLAAAGVPGDIAVYTIGSGSGVTIADAPNMVSNESNSYTYDFDDTATIAPASDSFELNTTTDPTQISLTGGHHIVLYGAEWSSVDERAGLETHLKVDGAQINYGASAGYSRDVSRNQLFTGGGTIIEVDQGAVLEMESSRTDIYSVDENRDISLENANIQLVKLDDSLDFLRLGVSTSSQVFAGSASDSGPATVSFDVEDEVDSASFGHSASVNSDQITLKSSGSYLVFANTGFEVTSSSERQALTQQLTLNGNVVSGSSSVVYLRNSGSTDASGGLVSKGAASIGMIVNVTDANSILSVSVERDNANSTGSVNLDAANTGITILKLPEYGDYISLEGASQDVNTTGGGVIDYSISPDVSTTSFDYDADTSASKVGLKEGGDYLFLNSYYVDDFDTAGVDNRTIVKQGFQVTPSGGGSANELEYGSNGSYNRDDSAGVDRSRDSGNWSGAVVKLEAGDAIETTTRAVGASATVNATGGVFLQGLNIASISSQPSDPVIANNIPLNVLVDSSGVVIDSTFLSVVDSNTVNSALTYTLTTEPAGGEFYLSGVQLHTGSTFTQKDIDDNLVTFNAGSVELLEGGFEFSVSDGGPNPAIGTFQVNVGVDLNALDDSGVTDEDTSTSVLDSGVAVSVLDNDTGTSVVVFSAPSVSALGASVSVNTDGTFTYDPRSSGILQALDSGVSTIDTFSYTVRDFRGVTDTRTVSFTVNGLNDAPDVVSETVAVTDRHGISLNLLANESDVDAPADTLTIAEIDGHEFSGSGSVTFLTNEGATVTISADGSLIYDVSTSESILNLGDGASLSETLVYVVSDGSDSATSSITIVSSGAVGASGDLAQVRADQTVAISALENDSVTSGPAGVATSGALIEFLASTVTNTDSTWINTGLVNGGTPSIAVSSGTILAGGSLVNAPVGITAAYSLSGGSPASDDSGSEFLDIGDPVGWPGAGDNLDTTDSTIELVFRPSDQIGEEVLFETGGTGIGSSIVLVGNQIVATVSSNTDYAMQAVATLPEGAVADGEFVHLMVHFNVGSGDGIEIFVNNVSAGITASQYNLRAANGTTATASDWSGTDDASLGRDGTAVGGDLLLGEFGTIDVNDATDFTGEIATLRIYDSLLDASQRSANFESVFGSLTDEVTLAEIASINGSANPGVGNPILLSSGAQVTLEADGSFTYDPNGAFDDVNIGETATDSFVYSLDNSIHSEATVRITIEGVNPELAVANLDQTNLYLANSPEVPLKDLEVSGAVQLSPGALLTNSVPDFETTIGVTQTNIGEQAGDHNDGLTFEVVFTPDLNDLTGTVMLMEIGGGSNGVSLFLVNGIPTVVGKMSSNDQQTPDLSKTRLAADGTTSLVHDLDFNSSGANTNGVIAVQHAGGALTADTVSRVTLVYDPLTSGTMKLIVDGAGEEFTFQNVGSRNNWSGDDTVSVAISPGTGAGGSANISGSSDFFNSSEIQSLSGELISGKYYNDSSINLATANGDRISAMLTLSDPTVGSLSASSGNGETYDAVSGEWSIIGDSVSVNAALASVAFIPNAGNAADASVEIEIADEVAGFLLGSPVALTGDAVLNYVPVSISSAVATENSELEFVVTLDEPALAGGVTVTFSTSDGTAVSGSDFVAQTGASIVIAEGDTIGVIRIATVNDIVDEAVENFTVTVTGLAGFDGAASTGLAIEATATILDNEIIYVDDSFSGSVGDVILDADLGTSGTQGAVFGVNAFATIAEALEKVDPNGVIILNAGTYADDIELNGTVTIRVSGDDVAQIATVSGEISGGGSLVKDGAGLLRLTAANTYLGETTVRGGVLEISNASALGATSAGTTVNTNAQLRLTGGVVFDSEPLTIEGAGLNDGTTPGRGALRSHGGDNTWTGEITLEGAGDVWISSSDVFTLAGNISGDGKGLRIDQGARNVTGTIDLGSGRLLINSQTRLQAANTFGSLFIDWNGKLTTEIDGAVPDGIAITLGSNNANASAGNGVLDLAGHDLVVSKIIDGNVSDTDEVITNSSGVLATFTVEGSDDTNFLGSITGNLSLVKAGSGSLILAGVNSYTGTTSVSAGTLKVDGEIGNGGPSGMLSISDDATLTGSGAVFASINGEAGSNIVTSGNLTLGDPSADAFSTAGNIAVNTGHTLTLRDSGAAELGSSTIVDGTLVAAGGISLSADDIISGSGVIDANLSEDVAVNAGVIRPGGASGDPGVLTVNSDLDLAAGSTIQIDVNGVTGAGVDFDQIIVDGEVNLDGASLDFSNSSFSGSPAVGTEIVIISNLGTDPITGSPATFSGLPEGSAVTIGNQVFEISYTGGTDNNDVTLTVAGPIETTVTTSGTSLVITDSSGSADTDDNLKLTISDSGYTLTETTGTKPISVDVAGAERRSAYEVFIPFSSLSGQDTINFDTLDGVDILTLDFAGFTGTSISQKILFTGGAGDGDTLMINNGVFTTVTHTMLNASSGEIDLNGGLIEIDYSGLEPVLFNFGTVTDFIFELPAGTADSATLTQDSVTGLLTLDGATFESTTFAAPTGSITINGQSGDSVTISDSLDLTGADGDGTSLFVNVESINISGGSVDTNGSEQSYNGAVVLEADTVFTGGNITFGSTIDSDVTARSLTVNSSGTTTFSGDVGAGSALAALTTDAAGDTVFEKSAPKAQSLSAGIQAYLSMEGGVTDASGNGRDGTPNGDAVVVVGDSPVGGDVLSLDGDGDYVTLSGYTGVTDPTGMTPITMSAWIKTSGSGVNIDDAIMAWGVDSGGQKWVFRFNGDNLRVETANGGIEGTIPVNDGKWHHVVVVYDPTLGTGNNHNSISFYVDGQLDAISTNSGAVLTGPGLGTDVHIGSDQVTGGGSSSRDFNGNIDEAAIWDRALTAGEIQSLANRQLNVVTIGDQNFNDAVTVNADVTFEGANVSFDQSVDGGASSSNITVNSTEADADGGVTSFNGNVGATVAVSSLTTNSNGETQFGGTVVRTIGEQTYSDAVLFSNPGVLTVAGQVLNFESTSSFDGASTSVSSESATFTGDATFSGDASFTISNDIGFDAAVTFGGASDFSVSDNATFSGPVTIGGDSTVNANDVVFNGSIDSTAGTHQNLIINTKTGGSTVLNGAIGGVDALNSLITNEDGTVNLGAGTIELADSGVLTFSDAVTLTADLVISNGGAGDVSFKGTVNGAFHLTVNTPGGGDTYFDASVGGGTALASLTTDSNGTAFLGGASTPVGVPTLNFDADRESSATSSVWEGVAGAASGPERFDSGTGFTFEGVESIHGGISSAYRFDGSGNMFSSGVDIGIDNLPTDPSDNSASFEFWIRPSADSDIDVIYETGGSGTGMSVVYDGSSQEVIWTIDGGGNAVGDVQVGQIRGGLPTDNEFHQVFLVYSKDIGGKDIMEIYVDGVLLDDNDSSTTFDDVTDVDSNSINDFDGGNEARLGGSNGNVASGTPTPHGNFEGDIAKFRFYEGTKTAAEVSSNYDVVTNFKFSVVTSGDQSYQGAVGLASDVLVSAGNVIFADSVDSRDSDYNRSLTVNTAGSGVTTFGGDVGSANSLGDLHTNLAGYTVFGDNTGALTITTDGEARFDNAVLFNASSVLFTNEAASGSVVFANTVDGADGVDVALTVDTGAGGVTQFGGNVGMNALGALSNGNGLASITTDVDGITLFEGIPSSPSSATLLFDAAADDGVNGTWENTGSLSGYSATSLSTSGLLTTGGGTLTTSLPGITAAYEFDGAGSGANLAALEGLNEQTDVSFELWFRPSDLIGDEVLFESGGGNGVGIFLGGGAHGGLSGVSDSELVFSVTQNSFGSQTAFVKADLTGLENEFIHVVGTFDISGNGTSNLYINGSLVDSATSAAGITDWSGGDGGGIGRLGGVNMGGVSGGAQGFTNFAGQIAKFAVYESTLFTSDQVAEAYSLGTGVKPISVKTSGDQIYNNAVEVKDDVTVISEDAVFTSTIDLNDYDLTISVSGTDSEAAGIISSSGAGTGSVTKTGSGSLALNAGNTYSGPTTVDAGVLGGIGSVDGAIVVTDTGMVDPGTTTGDFGGAADINFAAATSYRVELGTTTEGDAGTANSTYDQIDIDGDVTLAVGALLEVSLVGDFLVTPPASGDRFVIVNNEGANPVSGIFSFSHPTLGVVELPDGALFDADGQVFLIEYDYDSSSGTRGAGNDIVLIAQGSAETSVELIGGELVISDINNDSNDDLTIYDDGTYYVISDTSLILTSASTQLERLDLNTYRILKTDVTNGLRVVSANGADAVTLGESTGTLPLNFGRDISIDAETVTLDASLAAGHTLTLLSDGVVVNFDDTGLPSNLGADYLNPIDIGVDIVGTNVEFAGSATAQTHVRISGDNSGLSGTTLLSGNNTRWIIGSDTAFGAAGDTVAFGTSEGQQWITADGNRTIAANVEIQVGRFILGENAAGASNGNLTVDGDVLLSQDSGSTDFYLLGSRVLTFNGVVSGTTGIELEGNQPNIVIALTNAGNTFSGDISFVTGTGTIAFANAGALGNSGNAIVYQSAGTIRFDGDVTSASQTVTLNPGITGTIDTNGFNGGISGAISGDGNFVKTGAGELSLESANSFTGTTTIQGGTLILDSVDALGSTSEIVIEDTAVLQENGIAGSLIGDTTNVTVESGGTFKIDKNEIIGGLSGAGVVTSFDGNDSNTASDTWVLTVGGGNATSTFSGVLQDAVGDVKLGLIKTGSGTLTLSGTAANTATGNVVVNSGLLVLNKTAGVNALGGDVNLNGGDIRYDASNQVSDSSFVTISSASSQFDLNGEDDTVLDLELTDGSIIGGEDSLLTLIETPRFANGVVDVVLAGSNGIEKVFSGTVDLNQSNLFTGGVTILNGELNLNHVGALNAAGTNAVVFDNDADGMLDLAGNSITIAGVSTQNGADSGSTIKNDSNTDATLTVNQTAGTSDFYGTLSDGSGTGRLALTKTGNGKLILGGANTHTGEVTISGGTLELGHNAALGNEATGKTIINGGTLDLGGFRAGATGNEDIEVQGVGVGGIGAITNSGADQVNALRRVTLTGDAIFNAANRFDIRNTGGAAFFNMGGHTLTKTGAGEFWLTNVGSVVNPGSVDVTEGKLRIAGTTDFDGNGTIGVSSGAILEFRLGNITHSVNIALDGGSTLQTTGTSAGGSGAVLDGTVTLNGAATVNTTEKFLTISGPVTGSGGIIKTGSETLFLSNGGSDYTGVTVINGGALIQNGAHDADAGDYTVAGGAVLGGTGTITTAGTVTVDGILATGDPDTAGGIGDLTVNGDIAINSQFQFEIDGANSDTLRVTAPTKEVTLGGSSALLITDAANPDAGTTILVIDNEGADAVNGIFSGLAEGANVTDDDGDSYTISYVGGDGNDVVLFEGAAETNVDLTGRVLTVSDINSETGGDTLDISFDGTHYVITDANFSFSTTGLGAGEMTRPDANTVRVLASLVDSIVVTTANTDPSINDVVTLTGLPASIAGNVTINAETINIGVDVTTTGNQQYNGSVILTSDVTLTSSDITFNGTVDSDATERALTTSVSGKLTFNHNVGATSQLSSLDTGTTGSTLFSAQTYLDSLATGAGLLLNFDASFDPDGNDSLVPELSGAVDGSGNGLSLLVDTANVVYDGAVISGFAGISGAYTLPGAAGTDGNRGLYGLELQANGADVAPSVLPGAIDAGDATLEFWVKPDVLTGNQVIWETGGGTGTGFALQGSDLVMRVIGQGATKEIRYDLSTDTLNALGGVAATAEFFQITGVIDVDAAASNIELFVNGVSVGSFAGDALTDWDGGDASGFGTVGGANMGGFGSNSLGYQPFDGQVAAFRLYSGQLSQGDILTNFNAVAAGGQTEVSVTTSGDQTYGNAVALGVSTELNGNDITFDSTIDVDLASSAVGGLIVNSSGNGVTTFNGDIGGSTALASLVTNADGTVVVDTANVVVSGGLNFNDDLTSNQNLSINAGSVTLGADSTFLGTLDLTATGDAIFAGAVNLNDGTVVSAGNITFDSTVDGAVDVALNSSGVTTINGVFGGTTGLASLTTDNVGRTDLCADITVAGSGGITIGDPLLLCADVTVTSGDAAGDIFFMSQIESESGSAYGLTVNTTGGADTYFYGSIGTDALGSASNDAGLGSLTTDGAGEVHFGPNLVPSILTTNLAVDFNAATDGDGNSVWESTTSNQSRNWTLSGGVTSGVATPSSQPGLGGAYHFDGSTGGTATSFNSFIGSLDSAVELWIRPSDLVGQELLFETGGTGLGYSIQLDNADVVFAAQEDAVDSHFVRAVGAITSTTEFTQIVAVWDDLTDADPATAGNQAGSSMRLYINGVEMTSKLNIVGFNNTGGTDGAGLGQQNAAHGGGSAVLEDSSTVDATFNSPYEGDIAIMRVYTNQLLSSGQVSQNYDAVVNSPFTIRTVNDQTYHDSALVAVNTIFEGANVTFNGTLDAVSANEPDITINTHGGGVTTFNSTVGGVSPIGDLTTNKDGITVVNADIIARSDTGIIFLDAVQIDSGLTITQSGTGADVIFNNTLDSVAGETNALTISTDSGGGQVVFLGDVGGVDALASLTTDDAKLGGSPLIADGAQLNYESSQDDGANATWENTSETDAGTSNLTLDPTITFGAVVSTDTLITHSYTFPGGTAADTALPNEGNSTTPLKGAQFDTGLGSTPGGSSGTVDATFELWFKPADLTTANQFLMETGGGTGIGIYLSGSTLQLRRAGGGTNGNNVQTFDITGLENDFIQVVAVNEIGGDLILYVNGSEVARGLNAGGSDWDGGDFGALGTKGQQNAGGVGGDSGGRIPFAGEMAIYRQYNGVVLDASQISDNYLAVAGGKPVSITTTGDQIYTGNVDVCGDATLTGEDVIFESAVDLNKFDLDLTVTGTDSEAQGVISGEGNVTKAGGGTFTTLAANTYSGTTDVSAGSLIVNGAHLGGDDYTIANAADLGGTGTITLADATKTISGGGISPGDGGIGTLTINNNTTVGGDFEFDIDGAASDTLHIDEDVRTVTLNGTSSLTVTDSGEPGVGATIMVIQNDGTDAVSGTFGTDSRTGNNLVEGAVVTDDDGNEYTISYSGGDGNDVVLFAGKAETHVDLTGGVLTIADINADSTDTLQITYNSGDNTYTIRETANANLVISTTGLTSAQVTRPDARTVVVDASAVTGLVVDTTGVTADVEANDRVTITGDAAIPLSGDFAVAADDVVITAGTQIAVTGAGTVTINANQQIDLLSGSSITTDQGDIILNANLAGNAVGDATGIDLNNATIGSNGGNITLNGSASGAGTVGIDLRGGSTVTTTNGTVDISAGSGDLSLVNTDVSGGGKVSLSADDNLMLDAASSITSTGDEIEITVDQIGAADAAGSSVELLGSVNAANQVYISGGADRDQFNIVPSVFSVINIDGGSPSYVDDGDILNTLNAINPQRVVLVEGFSGTFTFGGGQKAINYVDIERDNIPSLEIDIPISQRLFPTTVNGTFTDFGLTENHILTVDWKDPDGGISTFNAPSFNDGLAVGMVINSTTDGAQLRITSIDPTAGEVSFTVSHTYQQDGLYNVAVSVTDPTDARVEASTVAEVYFLAPFNGNAGFFSFADLPGRLTLNGISGLFQDLRLSRLFATDFDGNELDLSNLGQNSLIGAYVSLEGEVRVVVLTGVEKQPDDFLTALNNSILNGTPLDLSGNVLSVDSTEVLQMITDLILIDVDGVED